MEVSPVRTPEGVLLEAPTELPLLDLDLDPFEADRFGIELPCRVQDPELWFAESPADLELAKSHCLSCPVRRTCLSGALERHEPWGVWGGEIFERGVVIPRKRPRGRPRKEVAA
jgi:WhiB family transcriptional regulator, redox-sensing transcriptional regulator